MIMYISVHQVRTQSVPTETPGQRLCNRIMVHANAGIYRKKTDGLLVCPQSIVQQSQRTPISEARAQDVTELTQLWVTWTIWIAKWWKQDDIWGMHSRRGQYGQTEVTPTNFNIVEFVMLWTIKKPRHKLTSKWIGTERITPIGADLARKVERLDCIRTDNPEFQEIIS